MKAGILCIGGIMIHQMAVVKMDNSQKNMLFKREKRIRIRIRQQDSEAMRRGSSHSSSSSSRSRSSSRSPRRSRFINGENGYLN